MSDAEITTAGAAEPADADRAAPMTLFVCVTCRDADHSPDAPSAGARLFEAIRTEANKTEAAGAGDGIVTIVPVECLSVCKRVCAVGFAAPGKWTYVYGGLPSDTAAPTVLAGARLYAQAPDGLIPWKQRPDALKKGVVARVPPFLA